ncbi:MAG: glycosyltransferase family 9 protein, partial [Aquificae bacterium]|nr:glycosyltransferase family 9 protein [Aquificota bacterium]
SLLEAINIVQNAKLIIGNETGLTHLGYLSGIPTVCFLGGGHFGRFLPWKDFNSLVVPVYWDNTDCFQCKWMCEFVDLSKKETPPCIYNINETKALEAIEKLNEKYKIFS